MNTRTMVSYFFTTQGFYILYSLNLKFVFPYHKKSKKTSYLRCGYSFCYGPQTLPLPEPITRLATLLHDIGKTKTFWKDKETELITFHNHEVVGTIQVTEIAKRLKLSKSQSEKLIRLVKYHQFTVSEEITDKAVRRFIRDVGKEYIQDMLDLRTADRIGSGATPTSWRYELFKKRVIEVQKEPFKVSDLKVDGHDVMKIFNIKPSRQIGDILDKLFEEVVEGKLKNDREVLLAQLSSQTHAPGI